MPPNPMRLRCGHDGANTVNLNPPDPHESPAPPLPPADRRGYLPVLAGALAAALFLLFADPFLSPPDCVSYWAWGESVLRDLDLSFSNQYAIHEMPRYYVYATATGRLANDWPAGSGLALIPAMPFGRIASQAWVCILAIWALALGVRRVAGCTRGGVFACVATLLGTPLFFYLACGPFFSHAVSFAIVSAFLMAWAGTLERREPHEWLLLGLLLGGATLVRPQNALLALAFLPEAPAFVRREGMPRAMLALAAGAGMAFAPALIANAALHGTPLVLPKAEEMHWLHPHVAEVLLSDYHGVLPWTPVHVLGIAGLVWLARRRGCLGAGLLLVFAAQVYVNSANLVWWCGGSFGNRRLADVAVVVAFGLGALWDATSGRWRKVLVAATVACVAWTLLLLLAERRLLVPLDRYVPFDAELGRALLRTVTSPGETIWSSVRPLVAASSHPGPFLARVLSAGAVGLWVWWIARRVLVTGAPILPPSAFVSRVGVGLALVLSAWVGVAAARTTPLSPDALARAGREPAILWDNYVELAHYHVVRKEYEGAKSAALRALAIRPGTPTPWWYLALASYESGDRRGAEEAARRVLAANPSHPGALDLLARLDRAP